MYRVGMNLGGHFPRLGYLLGRNLYRAGINLGGHFLRLGYNLRGNLYRAEGRRVFWIMGRAELKKGNSNLLLLPKEVVRFFLRIPMY